MVENNITKLNEVSKYINMYFHDPDKMDKIVFSQAQE